LDLTRKKLEVCLRSEARERLGQLVSPSDGDALRSLARRIEETHREPVCAVVESMSSARFVHCMTRRDAHERSNEPLERLSLLGARLRAARG
jgi:hypothetical protein